MKKILTTGAWACGAIAVVLMLLGSIAALLGGGQLFNHYWANYFYPSVSFVGLGILMLLLQKAAGDK
jgi:hypothetical protein